jgi:hypothetical protein
MTNIKQTSSFWDQIKDSNICDGFLDEDNAVHHHHEQKDGERVWSMMFYTSDDQSCAVVGTDDEIAWLLSDDTISGTFTMIGDSVDQWEDEKQCDELIEKALAIIDSRRRED